MMDVRSYMAVGPDDVSVDTLLGLLGPLKGAKKLSRKELLSIYGGGRGLYVVLGCVYPY
jgi:hypothetical protein